MNPTLKLEMQVLTPLFLAGAEARGAPEWRVPSLRGALRYWLRAALAGVLGDRDLDALQRAEAQVFGSTHHASSVTLRIESPPFQPVPLTRQRAVSSGKRMKPTGRDYLWWSMAPMGDLPPKQMIPEGTHFTLTLAARAGAPEGATAFMQAAAALWLWVHLGGWGSRARRTAGSVGVVSPVSVDGLPSFLTPATPAEFADLLREGVSMIRQQMAQWQNQPLRALQPPTRFDVLHPATSQVWVLTDAKVWTSADQAVEAIGSALRDFRSDRKPDHNAVRAFLERGTRPPTIERAAFGLPLAFRYSDGPTDILQGSEHDRRASPLWLRVARLASGQWVGVAVLFDAALLPRHESLQFQRARKQTAPPANYDLIRRWVTEKFTALEVNFR